MVRIAKKDYYNNLNVRNITDVKQFWKIVGPFFNKKVGVNEKITQLAEEKYLIVCFYHVTYEFESESTLYSCLNVKELLARNRRHI